MPIFAASISYTYTLKMYLYKFTIHAFDACDDLLNLLATALRRTHSISRAEKSYLKSDHWNDEEFVQLYDKAKGHGHDECSALRISYDTVVKALVDDPDQPEIAHINLVRASTSILTPSIRRTFKHGNYRWIVMQYIDGMPLNDCWDWLSHWTRLRVAFTLRRYIKQLRKIRSEHSKVPGPIATMPKYCRGLLFGGRDAGPFETPRLLSRWLQHEHSMARDLKVNGDIPIPFNESKPLVFTHHDIRWKNIILGKDGKVWLTNWNLSGFYPEWFEYVAMDRAASMDQAPRLWNFLIPFIAYPYMPLADYVGDAGSHIKIGAEDH